jgi:membrane-associated protein
LFTAGFLIQTGILPVNLYLFIAIAFIAAVAGDSVGYAFGRRVGPKLFNRPNSKLFKQQYIHQAEVFYKNHGSLTIVIARFMPIVRTFAPIVAGTAKMPYKLFITYNIIGGLLWTAGITSIGFVLGSVFHSLGIDIDTIILPIVAVIILISVLPPVIHILKDKKNRDVLLDGTRRQIKILVGKAKR